MPKQKNSKRPTAQKDYAALAGMSDDAVREKTGKAWAQWVRTLDGIGASKRPHREIALHVHETYGLSGWWAQTVTVGYERIRGLRDIGQRRGGTYEANKSKTFPVPLSTLYGAFAAAGTRRRWLPAPFTVRTAAEDKSMRITWADGTSVELYFTAKGGGKSQVAVQHRKLPSKAEAAKMKTYWTERLEALGGLFGTSKAR